MASEFILTDLWGAMEQSDDPEAIAALVKTLDAADQEHGDVSVSQPSGWTISAYANGNVVLGNVEDRSDKPRHMKGLSRSDAVRLMKSLAADDFKALEAEPWIPGYPTSR